MLSAPTALPDHPPAKATSEIIIQTKALTKQFKREIAVNKITFDLPRGKIFGFIGPSGSGKTTTVRLLTGIYKPTSGWVTVLGHDPAKFSQSTQARIGYMPQNFMLYRNLSVWENLNFAASIYGVNLRRAKRLKQVLDFVELTEHRSKLVRQISGGMQRRLSLATTLVHNPELLFLDEPTAGVDPVLRRKFWDHFKELQQEERTLFVTTQYVTEAAYCDLVGVMARGRLLIVDTPAALRRRAFGGEVVDLYTTERISDEQLQYIRALPFVQSDITRLEDKGLRLIVDKANTAIPALLACCQSQELALESIEEYVPPFDDVFVELVKENGTSE